MKTALIGHTGFVGGTIHKQALFNDVYNSKNIRDIRDKSYDLVVCAAAPGIKWLANKEPEKDWASISSLIECLQSVNAGRFVLISTIDVYPIAENVDEDSTIDPKLATTYGRHRYQLENFVADSFPKHTIVRLPGLFGEGIKKNIIFDFIHDNEVEKINPQSQFQFYNLENIWHDIQVALDHDVSLINFATEPVTVSEVYKSYFHSRLENKPTNPAATYDMHTKFASLYGQERHYLYSKRSVLNDIAKFIAKEREVL